MNMDYQHTIKQIDKAIVVMNRAKVRNTIDMRMWQSRATVLSELDFHLYGSRGCFAGHIAISKEFQDDGGTVCKYSGSPGFEENTGYKAIAEILNSKQFIL